MARAASAWPRISFITDPISAPAADTLPALILSAIPGFASIARSTAAPRAPSSETSSSPRAVTTSAGDTVEDVIWTYEQPYPAVAEIAGHVAFYPDKADISVIDE